MGGSRSGGRRTGLLGKFSMSSSTDLTKAWLESLPADVDEPTGVPQLSTKPRTQNVRDGADLVLSNSASAHPLRRQQSRGDTSSQAKRSLANYSTSAQSVGLTGVAGRSGKIVASQTTYDESSDVDKAFDKLLGDFSAPSKTVEVKKTTAAKTRSASSPQELLDGESDRYTSTFVWNRPTVIKARTGHRKLPVPDRRNESNTGQESPDAEGPTETEVRWEEEKAVGRKRSDKDTGLGTMSCNSRSPSYRSPVKAVHDIQCRTQNFSNRTPTVSESDASKDSPYRRSFRNYSVASSADSRPTYQSSRDFATQTFGQMATTSMANCEAQTEISAVTKSDEMLKHSLMDIKGPHQKYLSQHSLESARSTVTSSRDKVATDDRKLDDCSKCRTNSSKSLCRELENSKKSKNRLQNESFDESVGKWSKKDVRSADNTVFGSDRFDGHSKEFLAAGDVASVKSRSLSGTSNSRRLMSLMLEEVKSLKSFVQTHLDERQPADRVGSSQTRTQRRSGEKDPDIDSAVELAIVDRTAKKREESDRAKHRSNKSHKHHSRHRRTENEENEDEYRRRRRSPTREKTGDDVRRWNSVEDMRSRYLSTAEGRRHIDAPAYDTSFPHGTLPSNYHRFIPAGTRVNPSAYQAPSQFYQNRYAVPFHHGFGQPPTILPSYPTDPGSRLGVYAPVNTHPVMYSMPPADHAFPLRGVQFPNSVGPTVYQAPYQATLRPALTFVPAVVTPMGQTMQSMPQGAWTPRGQFVAMDGETRNPNIGLITNRSEDLRVKKSGSSARNSYRSASQPRKQMSSLDDALREAQGIRNLTERLGKDTQLPSYCY